MVESIKVILLGDSGVGKTSFLMRFTENVFPHAYGTTIGVDFKSKEIQVKNRRVVLKIWDTAGQERFKSVGTAYYRDADGIIIMYDVSKLQSFTSCKQWYNEAMMNTSANIRVLFVGNKSDQQAEVDLADAKSYAQQVKAQFVESSALEGYNVHEGFQILAEEIINERKRSKSVYKKEKRSQVLKEANISAKRKKKSCC